MRKFRYIAAFVVAILLLCAAIPVHAAVFAPDIRVLLSIGKPKEFSFTPVGEFTLLEFPELKVGTDELTVTATGGRVSITIGGKTVSAATLTFLSANYGERTDYIRLKNSEHGTCTYLGNMMFEASGNVVRAINTLPIEQYVYGVVPHEMSNLFPIDALKAQAVCARGYAIARCSRYGSRAYDILDTSQDQVYRGFASRNTRAIAAVDATKGQVLTYDGDIIESYYAASNGGQTERTGNVWENDLPYYINADDPYDIKNASSLEEKSFIPEIYNDATIRYMDPFVLVEIKRAAYEAAGQEVELLSTVSVTPKNPSYDEPSRCYTEADVTLMVSYVADKDAKTGQLTVTLTLDELYFGSFENNIGRIGGSKTRLRMRSVERGTYRGYDGSAYGGWYLTERRYGHGVGLSQRGAQERARAGQPYTDILAFYYYSTTLNTVGTYDTAPAIKSDKYTVNSAGISLVSLGTTADTLLGGLSSDGNLSVVNSKGAAASGGLCTGYFVRNTYDGGASFFDLPIIIYGDLDGDGKVGESDVASLQNHLLRNPPLTGARFSAADVNHDNAVNMADLIRLIQYVNGDAKI